MTRRRRINDITITSEFEARFWSKVDKGAGSEACWPWTAARSRLSYGLFTAFKGTGGKMASAHSVAFRLSHGIIPDGLDVLHSCDNQPCCNPLHLRAGTAKENSLDMCIRGRHPMSKLSPELIYGMRLLRQAFGIKWVHLSRLFGLAGRSGALNASQRQWQWVPKPEEDFDPGWKVTIDWAGKTIRRKD